jgi:glycosyltransferase involved in cell wall biosynthesis
MLIAGGVMPTLQQVRPDPAINYLGYVSNEELKFLYKNASLFIFPSFYEGFGIPPLEAMHCGCPVLSSNTSSLPEVLGDACAYCDPADTDDIAAKIDQLINNEQALHDLKIKGYGQAAKYSWENSARRLYTILDGFA